MPRHYWRQMIASPESDRAPRTVTEPRGTMLPGDRDATGGLQYFEAGDSAGALERLHRAMELGVSSVDSVEVYLALTAGAGMAERGIEAAERFLADERLDILPADETRLRADILRASAETEAGFDSEGQRLLA